MFSHMFVLTIPWIEKILRPMIVYAALVILLRIFGKRELAQLNPFDLVVLLSLSNTVQNAIIGDDNTIAGGLIGAVSLLGINYVTVRFLLRHRRLDQLIQGEPTTLIEHGKILKNGLAKELMTIPELITVAHRQGFTHLKDIDRCVLEPGGVIAVTPKPEAKDHFSDVLERLKAIQQQLDDLRRSPQP
jgi:uncharacterized membrane protein YcaP (DUF421 family)